MTTSEIYILIAATEAETDENYPGKNKIQIGVIYSIDKLKNSLVCNVFVFLLVRRDDMSNLE